MGGAQGAWAGFVGNQLQKAEGRGWMVAFFIATLYSFIYMPHSGLRACTRPIVWIAVLFGAKTLLWRLAPKKRRRAKEGGGRLKTAGQQAAPF